MYTCLHVYAHKKSGANCANELMVLLPGPMPRTVRSLHSRTVTAPVHLLFAVCGKVRGPTVQRCAAIFMLNFDPELPSGRKLFFSFPPNSYIWYYKLTYPQTILSRESRNQNLNELSSLEVAVGGEGARVWCKAGVWWMAALSMKAFLPSAHAARGQTAPRTCASTRDAGEGDAGGQAGGQEQKKEALKKCATMLEGIENDLGIKGPRARVLFEQAFGDAARLQALLSEDCNKSAGKEGEQEGRREDASVKGVCVVCQVRCLSAARNRRPSIQFHSHRELLADIVAHTTWRGVGVESPISQLTLDDCIAPCVFSLQVHGRGTPHLHTPLTPTSHAPCVTPTADHRAPRSTRTLCPLTLLTCAQESTFFWVLFLIL